MKEMKNASDISNFAGKIVAYKLNKSFYNIVKDGFKYEGNYFAYIGNEKYISANGENAYLIKNFLMRQGESSNYLMTDLDLAEEIIKMRLATSTEISILNIKVKFWEIRLSDTTKVETFALLNNAQEEYQIKTAGDISENNFDF